jgi:large subunit ribosomal protein L21
MYAVVENGGKQFRVAPGDVVRVDTMAGDAGATVELGRVLSLTKDSGEVVVGKAAAGVKVLGNIVGNDRGEKVIVFKFKRKKQYKKTIGHRQNYTAVKVSEIKA